VPSQLGFSGVIRGATGTFFGYLGYDQVCCLGGEAINPKRNLPLAIITTLVAVTILYMVATLALTGMQPWESISPVSGFPSAFYALDVNWAGQITAFGEILTLPIVVLLSIMAQPRLQYAMAEDGMLPSFFQKLDQGGNLRNGLIVSGGVMVVVASFVPFTHLNDVISCAVLCALSLTDTSLVLLWYDSPEDDSALLEWLMFSVHIGSLVASVAFTHYVHLWPGTIAAILGAFSAILATQAIHSRCMRSNSFKGHQRWHLKETPMSNDGYFRTPWLPFWPCTGIFVNWYLVAQLNFMGVAGLAIFLGMATIYYFAYARYHAISRGNKNEDPAAARVWSSGCLSTAE
jgi:APA family basic amino acid/polyamine antiporter